MALSHVAHCAVESGTVQFGMVRLDLAPEVCGRAPGLLDPRTSAVQTRLKETCNRLRSCSAQWNLPPFTALMSSEPFFIMFLKSKPVSSVHLHIHFPVCSCVVVLLADARVL